MSEPFDDILDEVDKRIVVRSQGLNVALAGEAAAVDAAWAQLKAAGPLREILSGSAAAVERGAIEFAERAEEKGAGADGLAAAFEAVKLVDGLEEP